MKRKIFSKLLMVALVIAAVGSFVSCKDYDDDINNLQKQIDAKAALSELTALQSTLDSKIAAAQTAATAAQAKADAAATKTSVDELKKALETAIADAKKAGTDAGTQAGTAIAAANKAQETADAAAQAAKDADAAAKAALADALKTIEETYQTKAAAAEAAEALAAVKATADAAFTKAEAEKLQEQVNDLKADLESQIEEKVKEAIKNVDNAVASVDAIWSAVAGVDLIVSATNGDGAFFDNVIKLYTGTIGDNARFGNQTKPEAEGAYDFVKGKEIDFDNNLLIRVTPTNATLTADMIKLIDSKGNDLSDIVTIGTPEVFDELLTRGASTGLWLVPVYRVKDIKDEAIEKAVLGDEGVGKTLYAVAINNTADAAADRYVYSTFDLTVNYGEYEAGADLAFNVNGKDVADIHNRWTGAQVLAEDGSFIPATSADFNPELVWAKADNDVVIPAYKQINNNPDTDKDNNVAWDPANRQAIPVANFTVKVGEPIVISDIDVNTAEGKGTFAKSYYVTLDRKNAIESDPSEINAWNEYEIEGLDEVVPASKKHSIVIKDTEANGDVIGFRLFAVNYDGTLADPDGVAFYVQVGTIDKNEVKPASALTWQATTATPLVSGAALSANNVINAADNCGTVAIDGSKFKKLAIANNKGQIGVTNYTKFTNADDDVNVYDNWNTAAGTVYYVLLKADGKPADNWNEVASIKVAVADPARFVDAQELSFSIEGRDAGRNDKLVNTLTVTMKKTLGTTVSGKFTFKDASKPDASGKLTIMLYPTANPATDVTTWPVNQTALAPFATADLTNFGTYSDGTAAELAKFQWEFSGAQRADLQNDGAANSDQKAGKVVAAYGTTNVAAAANAATAVAGKFRVILNGSVFKAADAANNIGKWSTYAVDANNKSQQSKIGSVVNATLKYNVGNISLKKNADGSDKGLTPSFMNAWSGTADLTYEIATQFQSYELAKYTYVTAINAGTGAATKYETSNDFYIQYNQTTPNTSVLKYSNVDIDGYNGGAYAGKQIALPFAQAGVAVTAGINFATAGVVVGKNTIFNSVVNHQKLGLGAADWEYLASGYQNVVDGALEAASHSFNATLGDNSIFVPSVTPAGVLIFTPAAVAPTLTQEVTQNLKVTVKDVFGIEHTIINQNVVIKP